MRALCLSLTILVGTVMLGCERPTAVEGYLDFSTKEIHFTDDERTQQVVVQNPGDTPLIFTVTPSEDWILIDDHSRDGYVLEARGSWAFDVRLSPLQMGEASARGQLEFATQRETHSISVCFRGRYAIGDEEILFTENWDDGDDPPGRWSRYDADPGAGRDSWGLRDLGNGNLVADAAADGIRDNGLGGGYDHEMDSTLELKAAAAVDITGHVDVSVVFDLRWDAEAGRDYLRFEVFDGYEWIDAGLRWSGGFWQWQRTRIDLDDFSLRDLTHIQFRFRAITNDRVIDGLGFQIDNIVVVGKPKLPEQ